MRSIQRRIWEKDRRMHIIAARGVEMWVSCRQMKPRKVRIQSQRSFTAYVSAAIQQNIKFDVVINDGQVKPQVALAVKRLLPMRGNMIVFDTAIPSNKFYEIISRYYNLVKEWGLKTELTVAIQRHPLSDMSSQA